MYNLVIQRAMRVGRIISLTECNTDTTQNTIYKIVYQIHPKIPPHFLAKTYPARCQYCPMYLIHFFSTISVLPPNGQFFRLCHCCTQWAIFSSMACPALSYFPTRSHKQHDFRKEELLNINCVFWFSPKLSSVTFLPHSKKNWARYYQKNASVCM